MATPTPAAKRTTRQIILKILMWTGIFLFASIVILILIAMFFEERIARVAIGELKKVLKTELTVGNARLSLVWSFPKAALYLENVELKGAYGDQPLMKVGTLALKCDIIGLLAGDYEFTAVEIANGDLYIERNKKGEANYDVFISSGDTSSGTSNSLHLSIENAALKNVNVHFVDKPLKQDISVKANSASFSGSFTDTKYTMSTYAELHSNYIQIDDDTYLKDKDLSYDAYIDIDKATNTYTFKDIGLTVEANEFKVNGTVAAAAQGSLLDLTFAGTNCRLGSVLKMMPSRYLDYLQGFESQADLYFDASVKGLYSPKSQPTINMKFGLKDGRVSHPNMASTMKDVSFEIVYTNQNAQQQAVMEFKDFLAEFDGEPIGLAFSSVGNENPQINFAVNGTLPLASVFGLMGRHITEGSGYVNVEQLSLQGLYNDMTVPSRIANVKLDGILSFEQASLTVNGIRTTLETGTISLQNNLLRLEHLELNSPKNNLLLNGDFHNALPVLLSDSLNSNDAQLTFRASLHSNNIDVNELILLTTDPQAVANAKTEVAKDSLVATQNAKREFITQFLVGQFTLNIENFKWGKVISKHINGLMEFQRNIMNLRELKVDAMSGAFELNSRVHFDKEPFVESFLECKNVDIQQFFIQCENFGQDNIEEKNIRGRLDALIKTNFYWDSEGNFKHEKLYMLADMMLREGELIDMEVLDEASKFIKTKDLDHIKFTDLRNQFRIENGAFYMPAMFIRSNAANLVISGRHSFNQECDYKIKVNAGQVLMNKFKKYNSDMEPLKARQNGLFNVYLRIFGNMETGAIQFKMGKKNVKKELELELKQQMPAMQNSLREEFANNPLNPHPNVIPPSLQPIGEPSEWEDIPEYDENFGNDK